jgi:hypothetical protein
MDQAALDQLRAREAEEERQRHILATGPLNGRRGVVQDRISNAARQQLNAQREQGLRPNTPALRNLRSRILVQEQLTREEQARVEAEIARELAREAEEERQRHILVTGPLNGRRGVREERYAPVYNANAHTLTTGPLAGRGVRAERISNAARQQLNAQREQGMRPNAPEAQRLRNALLERTGGDNVLEGGGRSRTRNKSRRRKTRSKRSRSRRFK